MSLRSKVLILLDVDGTLTLPRKIGKTKNVIKKKDVLPLFPINTILTISTFSPDSEPQTIIPSLHYKLYKRVFFKEIPCTLQLFKNGILKDIMEQLQQGF